MTTKEIIEAHGGQFVGMAHDVGTGEAAVVFTLPSSTTMLVYRLGSHPEWSFANLEDMLQELDGLKR